MTKEELKQEAEEWLCNNLHSASEEDFIKAMVDIAEPREKQIQIDAKQIRALQKQNGELTDELKDLRESIKDYGAGCYENGLRNGKRKLEAQIAELEKENAELKEKVNILDNCDRLGDVITEAYKEQLTKAKELLKQWLQTSKASGCNNINIVSDTEQFLNEVEK